MAIMIARFLIAGRQTGAPALRSRTAWCCTFTVVSIVVGGLCARGMLSADPLSLIVLSVVLVGCVAAQTRAESIARFVSVPRHPYVRSLALVLIASLLAMMALEIPWNHEIWNMVMMTAILEYLLIAALLSFLYYLPRRHGVLAAAAVAVLAGIGVAQYFVVTFRQMPIQPGDLFALSTAASVADSYIYVVSAYCLYGIAFAAVAICLFSLSFPLTQGSLNPSSTSCAPLPTIRAGRALADEAEKCDAAPEDARDQRGPAEASDDERHEEGFRLKLPLTVDRRTAVLSAAFLAGQAFVDYYNTLDVRLYTWRPLGSYYDQGFLPTFISTAQMMIPPKPKHFNSEDADKLIKRYAASWDSDANGGLLPARAAAEQQFEELKPSIICIMNESFSDLSIFDGLRCGYKGPQRFASVSDALFCGTSYMSAFGGGTCNSEFEFLTGHSMAFLGSGVYPFMTYNLAPTENLARQFAKQGYHALAMHPNHASNWNRVNVFNDMGFEHFYSIKDFVGAEELCRKVTDAATYDKCLDLLRSQDEPVFIHDVTMQNHSGYDTGLIPPAQRLSYVPAGVDADHIRWTNEYLALIEASDVAFRSFLDSLSKLSRPVVVVMYGDHQPFFTDAFNDSYFKGEPNADHTERIWQTKYMVWANYDVAGARQHSDVLDTSINNVGALALEAIGAPLSSYQRAHLALRKEMPAINVVGYRDAAAAWHLSEETSDASEARENYAAMQYRALFDHGQSIFATRRQTEANETDANAAPGTDI